MEHSPNKNLLSKYTAEFDTKSMEESFLSSTWNDNKTATRNTLLIVVFLTIVFFIRDIMEVKDSGTLYLLLYMRIAVICAVFFSSLYIHRATSYFSNYHHLVFFNQIVISSAIFVLAITREMPVAYLGVNTILFMLIYYQFINNKFYHTIIACVFLGVGAVLTGVLYLNMNSSDLIASVLFLLPLNFLGSTILRSINKSRRFEYLALIDLKKTVDEREKAIQELRTTLAEVKTLRGFLPICAKCKKIRDDEGYWNQIESYIEKHSEAQFSHGICQECADELYGDAEWYKKRKRDKTS